MKSPSAGKSSRKSPSTSRRATTRTELDQCVELVSTCRSERSRRREEAETKEISGLSGSSPRRLRIVKPLSEWTSSLSRSFYQRGHQTVWPDKPSFSIAYCLAVRGQAGCLSNLLHHSGLTGFHAGLVSQNAVARKNNVPLIWLIPK